MVPSGSASGATISTIGWPTSNERFSYDTNSKVLKQNNTGLVLTDTATINEDIVASSALISSNNLQKWVVEYTGETATVNSLTEQIVKLKNKGSNLYLTKKSDLFL